MLKKVILCPNPYRDHELTVAKEAKRILDSVHCPNVVCVPFRNEEKPEGYGLDIRPLQQELRGADMIIAFGGDGTILHLSKTAAHRDIPVLGVNLGSLGFMAELEQKELGRLGELMDEKYTVESRMMLDVSVVREGRVIYSNLALNEVVVTRGAVSRVIRLHIRTEQGRLLDVTGDGVIVASPTGSTAYSLSAGGPVVEPTARNLIVSPICAHSVHANSYVLSPERTVTVQTEKTGYKPIFLSADGGRAFSLRNGDAVEIRRSKYETKLVRLSNKSFCDILQKKMPVGGGRYRYAVSAQKIKLNFAGRLQVILRESILSADRAQNLVVVKMMPGLGPAAGSAFDGMEIPAIVGTVSGDDTVLVVLRDEQSAAEFCTELTAMIK